jgi:hypothetical protein
MIAVTPVGIQPEEDEQLHGAGVPGPDPSLGEDGTPLVMSSGGSC